MNTAKKRKYLIGIMPVGGLRVWVWLQRDPRGSWVDLWIPFKPRDRSSWEVLNELVEENGGFRYRGAEAPDGNRWCFPRPAMQQGVRALARAGGDAGSTIEQL